eukprot:TRINITY_DN2226_c0_g1_i4.p1 TRINITY_DN2226_c0_g1~~TRINITY_DN2226_c0_g1_i4.p1  ORF type:complete len:200 (+),score=25.00 TRINITY_DN2226_c0_g1_i4:24-602(+)
MNSAPQSLSAIDHGLQPIGINRLPMDWRDVWYPLGTVVGDCSNPYRYYYSLLPSPAHSMYTSTTAVAYNAYSQHPSAVAAAAPRSFGPTPPSHSSTPRAAHPSAHSNSPSLRPESATTSPGALNTGMLTTPGSSEGERAATVASVAAVSLQVVNLEAKVDKLEAKLGAKVDKLEAMIDGLGRQIADLAARRS